MRISARNNIACTVLSIWEGETFCIVRLALRDGNVLSADISIESSRELEIKEGMQVRALFKSSEVLVSRTYPDKVSAGNRLEGRVIRIEEGAANSLIEIALGDGQRVTAVVSTESIEELDLGVDKPVVAFVPDTAIMVGV